MSGVFLTLCVSLLHGASGVASDEVSVMEGDSVTLNTDVETNHEDRIMWYFNTNRIAQITRNHSKICTDAVCPERFRDRLKLDHVTASLTITHINTTDSGPYYLQINNRNHEKMFNVSVHDAPAADRDEIKSVKEGESVTLGPGVINNPNYLITWFFNDIRIAEINGDPSTDVQCEDADGRFRDRLEVNQTGFLTIMNTRTTDSGLYKLQIISSSNSSFSIRRSRSFSVTVTGSGPSLAAVAVICAAVVILLVAAAAGVIYYLEQKKGRGAEGNQVQENPIKYSPISQAEAAANDASHEKTETATETPP